MCAWRKQSRLFPPGNRREESVTKDHVAFLKWQSRPENGKALISHASKVMFKILQARLQQYVNKNFQMFKLDLEKAEEPEIKLPTSVGSSKKHRVPETHLLLLY